MKVTAVTTWFPTEVRPRLGAFVVKDIQAIQKAGHQVRLVHLVPPAADDGTRSLQYEGIPVRRIVMDPKNPMSIWNAAKELPGYLEGADVVHSMAISALLPLVLKRPTVPWIHTEHWSGLTTPASLPALWRPAVPLVAKALGRPDVVTAVCEFLATPIRAQRGAKPTQIVPCIVPPLTGGPRPLPTPSDTLRLVSVGGLIERKDPICAIETLAVLKKRGVKASLTWAGDGPLREESAQLAATLGVELHLTGPLDIDGVNDCLAAADIFFGPTRADNFFVSVAEAIVAGRPVVVGARGGHGEYLTDEVGILIAEQDPEKYADAIIEMASRLPGFEASKIADTIGDAFAPGPVGQAYTRAYETALGA